MVSNEAGPEPLSAKVPMLETDDGVTESEAGFTETAEPDETLKEILTFVDEIQTKSPILQII